MDAVAALREFISKQQVPDDLGDSVVFGEWKALKSSFLPLRRENDKGTYFFFCLDHGYLLRYVFLKNKLMVSVESWTFFIVSFLYTVPASSLTRWNKFNPNQCLDSSTQIIFITAALPYSFAGYYTVGDVLYYLANKTSGVSQV